MNSESSILGLVRELRDDTTQLVRDEVSLAKAEIREIAAKTARNLTSLLIGGAVALAGMMVLLLGLAHWLSGVFEERGMAAGLAALLGFGTIAVMVIIAGAIMISKGLHALQDGSLSPTRTARSLHESKQWAKEKLS